MIRHASSRVFELLAILLLIWMQVALQGFTDIDISFVVYGAPMEYQWDTIVNTASRLLRPRRRRNFIV
jgi:hypothetical protein